MQQAGWSRQVLDDSVHEAVLFACRDQGVYEWLAVDTLQTHQGVCRSAE
jgi:hypothetical protein